MNSGHLWDQSSRKENLPHVRMAKADLGVMHEKCSTASCGFCVQEHSGPTCQTDTHHTRPATGVSRSGYAQECWTECCKHSPRTCRSEEISTYQSVSSTAPLRWRKKGALCWKDQAGQGYEDHGNCRRLFSSTRHTH